MAPKHWVWLTGLCVALAAPSANSQHREAGDVYLGVALGYNIAPDAEDEYQAAVNADDEKFGTGPTSVSIDDGVFGWGAYGGYFFSDALAVEAGYLGNADMEYRTVEGSVELKYDLSTSAFYGAVVAHLPMSDGAAVSPFIKAGLARWEIEYSGEGGSREFDGTDLLLGAGADVPMNEDVSIRGEWMMLLIEDEKGGTQHRFQVGVNFAF